MTLAGHRSWRWPSAAALAVVGLLLVATAAHAKLSCEEHGPRGGVRLAGLPAHPVAQRTYAIQAYVPGGREHVVYGAPTLGISRCAARRPRFGSGLGSERHRVPSVHWVHPAQDPDLDSRQGQYAFAVRFSRPGYWRLTVFDRRGRYRDLGGRRVHDGPAPRVRDSSPATAATTPAAGSGALTDGVAASLVGVGVLAVVAICAFALRPRLGRR